MKIIKKKCRAENLNQDRVENLCDKPLESYKGCFYQMLQSKVLNHIERFL